MKEKISQLAKEKFEYEKPSIIFSKETLVLEVETGKSVTDTIHISNSGNRSMKGIIYSSDPRLSIKENTFVGQEADICFLYSAKNEPDHQTKKTGIITVVSNFGEYELPFEVKIETPYFETSLGKVRDLYQFANLAKEKFEEALEIFKSDDFKRIILTKETDIQIYEGLIKSPSLSHALEAFLVAVHQKLKVSISAKQQTVSYTEVRESIKDEVTLIKKEWGYAEYQIEVDQPFLIIEEEVLSTLEFKEDEYLLSYAIDYELLPSRKNVAHILLKNHSQEVTITVEVQKEVEEHAKIIESSLFKRKKYEAKLIETYLKFRLSKCTKEEYEDQIEAILNSLMGITPSVLWQLWYAHLYMVSGQTEKLDSSMRMFAESENEILDESVEYYLAYLYLKVLYTKKEEDIANAIDIIGTYYENERSDWHLLWYLLYLDKSYDDDQSKRLEALWKEFEQGVISPVLYYEALCVYNKEPQLLKEIGPIERQIMHWAVKNKYMSHALSEQFVFMASRVKTYDKLLLKDLMTIYEYTQSTECLQAILRLLIIGQRTDTEYFKWYEAGVKKSLKITELYEYYMYSIPEDKEITIEQSVLLYFVYNNHLPEAKKIFLYAYIIKKKEEIGSIYRTYLRQMETFTKRMLLKESLSENLAVLYKEFITPDIVDEALAKALPAVLFCYEFICKNKAIKSIVTKQPEKKQEETYFLDDGVCYVTMETDHMTIFLVDEDGNRYTEESGYTMKRLFFRQDLVDVCYLYNKQDIRLLLYKKESLKKNPESESIKEERHFLLNRILENDFIDEQYKGNHYITMVEYYYDQADYNKLDEYLLTLDEAVVNENEIYQIIDYMIMRDLFEKAYSMIATYGFEMVNSKRVFKLVMHLLNDLTDYKEDKLLLDMCYYLYEKGKANCDILRYLIAYYEHSTEKMFELYQVARKNGLDAVVLEERLLGQMLFAESHIESSFEVFQQFYEDSNNKLLIRAYLNYIAYRYLVHGDAIMDQGLLDKMTKESFYHESKVCMLAMLKFYSDRETFTEDELKFIDYNLHRFINNKIIFKFFQNYQDKISLPDTICNRVYVEYSAPEDSTVMIYYTIDGTGESMACPMKNIYDGVYSKDFLLFYGESMKYYIVEEKDGTQKISRTEQVEIKEEPSGKENRYEEINQILRAKKEQNTEKLQQRLEQFAVEEYITSSLFTPL